MKTKSGFENTLNLYMILNLSVPIFLVYSRCSPVNCMVLLKEVVMDLYVVFTAWSFFINVLTVLNLTAPPGVTGYNIKCKHGVSMGLIAYILLVVA